MALEIKTQKYVAKKRILVDGMDWTMSVPGAATELAMSQAQRRIKRLDDKIKAKTATDEDYDLYDRLENEMYMRFVDMFDDGQEDKPTVKAWVANTPISVMHAVLEDLKKQAEDKQEADEGTPSGTEDAADTATEPAA